MRWEVFFFLTRQLIKLATKSLLKSTKSLLMWSNESMVLGDSFLNYDLAGPFNVAKKALHIISSEYPWSDIKLLYEFRWSIRSVFLS